MAVAKLGLGIGLIVAKGVLAVATDGLVVAKRGLVVAWCWPKEVS